jgi:hypothetical protein
MEDLREEQRLKAEFQKEKDEISRQNGTSSAAPSATN